MKKVFYLLFALLSTMTFFSCEKADDSTSGDGGTDTDIKLSISTSSLQYDADGGTQIITISTNAMYVGAESYVEWIDFKLNGTQLQVIVQPNTSTEARSSQICISVGASSDYLSTNKKQNYVFATVTQSGASNSGQIKGPKWVLVSIEAPTFTEKDVIEGNPKKYNPIYHTDSLQMEATKDYCRGYYSETVMAKGDPWDGASYLFRYEISQIPKELEGGGTIALYNKVSLPRHLGGEYDNNDYVQYHYYHCLRYIDCRIDGNKIRSKEEDFPKFNGYNQPVVLMNEHNPDLFEAEGYVYGDVPKGRKAGDKIQLSINASGIVLNDKYMEAIYTYEWRE